MSNQQLNSTIKYWDIIASRVYSATNTNLVLEASGPTANLLVKTNGNTIVTADLTGNAVFTKLPICSVLPVVNSQIVNKQYADSVLGPQGAQGAQGLQGTQGAQGSQGPQGIPGIQGAQGTQGPQGGQGGQGAQGAQGSQGAQGGQGAQGAQGGQGAQGSQGAQGGQGAQGAQGGQGAQGFQGNSGFSGFSGNSGSQGGQGGQGAQGPQGFVGNQGPSLTLSNPDTRITISGTTLSLPFDVPEVGGFNLDNNITLSSDLYLTSSSSIDFGVETFSYATGISSFVLSNKLSLLLIADAANTPQVYGGTTSRRLYYITSSERYKENIYPVPDNDEILKVQPVFFNYKDSSGNALPEKNIGFIAEEMADNEMGNYFVVRDAEGVVDGINPELMIPAYVSAAKLLRTNVNIFAQSIHDFTNEIEVKYLSLDQSIIELEMQLQSQ